MNNANRLNQQQNAQSLRTAKLRELTQQALRLNDGALRERVAVPNPRGGYTMVVRDIKG